MPAGRVFVPIGEALRDVTLVMVVSGARRARLRFYAAAQILRLAALVAGCRAEVTVRIEDPR